MAEQPPRWNRQELILALDLYFDVGAADYRSSRKVQQLSQVIRAMRAGAPHLADVRFRSPSAVSRKLKNIAWVDPQNTRGTAQAHVSGVDEEIWDEFADDRHRLAAEAAAIRRWVDAGMTGPLPAQGPPEGIGDALDAVAVQAGKRPSGQGPRISPSARLALERHSMARARRYFEQHGWPSIEDVSKTRCFDLLCQRGADELRVEVKGTSTQGREVLLTRNEVTHARRVFPRIALYILADVEVSRIDDVACAAQGGREIIRNPWDIREGYLEPMAYVYGVPASGV